MYANTAVTIYSNQLLKVTINKILKGDILPILCDNKPEISCALAPNTVARIKQKSKIILFLTI